MKYDDEKVAVMSSSLPIQTSFVTVKKWEFGIDVDFIALVKRKFQTQWDIHALEEKLNRYPNYTVKMRGDGDEVDLYFLHAKSQHGSAIPLMLLDGFSGKYLCISLWINIVHQLI